MLLLYVLRLLLVFFTDKEEGRMEYIGYKLISGFIWTITGLHIGGSSVGLEIGGKDNPIIRNAATNVPYIPGSSLKGKMRSLLELNLGYHNDPDPSGKNVSWGDVHSCKSPEKALECPICTVFGSSAEDAQNGPTRLIVRDALLDEDYVKAQRDMNPNWTPFDLTEDKYENTINRISARANPRNFERIQPGVKFRFEMIYRVFERYLNGTWDEGSKDIEFFEKVIQGLRLVENDTLGGGGSRGCGQIQFLFSINGASGKKLDEISGEDFKTIQIPQ